MKSCWFISKCKFKICYFYRQRISRSRLLLSDLISEGNYGLLKAANRFDHTRGFRFISYMYWVRQAILQSLNDNARMVRLPANVINKLSYLNREIAKFEFINEKRTSLWWNFR
jgi:RNA polymerase primary sigma factor